MITLYCAGPQYGLPEASPYCTKTEVQLKMAGLAYVKAPATPDMSPKGQLPFIEDDGEKIADSTFIRAHVERKYGFDFDAGLDARQRAAAWATERMLENHFGFTLSYCRWIIPENFDKGPARRFDGAPEAEREKLRLDLQARVAATLKTVGTMRHRPDEIMDLGARSLSALSVMMGDNLYLMGAKPCGTDATAFAILAGMLTPFFESPLRRRAEGFRNLTAYVARMMGRYYPVHPWG